MHSSRFFNFMRASADDVGWVLGLELLDFDPLDLRTPLKIGNDAGSSRANPVKLPYIPSVMWNRTQFSGSG